MTLEMPLAAQALTAWTAAWAGTKMMARSTGPGMSLTDRVAGQTVDIRITGVDRVDVALEAGHEVLQNAVSRL